MSALVLALLAASTAEQARHGGHHFLWSAQQAAGYARLAAALGWLVWE